MEEEDCEVWPLDAVVRISHPRPLVATALVRGQEGVRIEEGRLWTLLCVPIRCHLSNLSYIYVLLLWTSYSIGLCLCTSCSQLMSAS